MIYHLYKYCYYFRVVNIYIYIIISACNDRGGQLRRKVRPCADGAPFKKAAHDASKKSAPLSEPLPNFMSIYI